MDSETQRSIVREVLAHAAAGTTQLADASFVVDGSTYTDPERFAAEIDVVRRSSVVCLSADVAEPGDHLALDAGGLPVAVVRQDDGSVRAMANACRHRGAPVIGASGSAARSFTCPFHGWVYDRAGTLIATPRAGDGFSDVDLDGCALRTVEVVEQAGVVHVGENPAGPGAARRELDRYGLAAWQPLRTADGPAVWTSEWRANWKLLVETFLESYHVPRLHEHTVARYYLAEPSTWHEWPDVLRFQTSQRSLLDLAGRPETEWELLAHASVLYLLAPTSVLSFSVDHVAHYRFVPLDVGRTRVECRLYGAPDALPDTEQVARTLDLHRRVSGGEDFVQQEQIHAALAAGAIGESTFGRNEGPAIWFHRWVAAAVATAGPQLGP